LIDENEEEDDDRAIFSDVLHDIGDISIKSLDFFIGYISRYF
jgi:hypothetical protein